MTPDNPTPQGATSAEERHRQILETAARLICRHGYEGASIQQIAAACGLTKAGLYHHIRSKEELLIEIMSYGMDIFEEQVLSRVESIADPVARLEQALERNVLLVTRGRNKEITIILHEHDTLTGLARERINARKKGYVRFLETAFEEATAAGRLRRVDPTVAAYSFLGMVNWIYKWYRADGALPPERIAAEMRDVFFGGLLPRAGEAGPEEARKTA